MPDPTGDRGRPDKARTPTTGLDAAFHRRKLTDLRVLLDPWRQGSIVQGVPWFWVTVPELDPLTDLEPSPAVGALDRLPVVIWDGVRAGEEVPLAAADALLDVDAAPLLTAGRDILSPAAEAPSVDVPAPTGGDQKDSGASAPRQVPVDPSAPTRYTNWSVITSQTCDIMAVGPGSKHHTVQVSPLRLLTGTIDPGKIEQIRRHSMVEFHHVTAPPDAGDWAVDLRLSLPVSKSVLTSQQPRSAFSAEEEEIWFSERVAARLRRPAAHDEVSTTLVTKLQDLVRVAKGSREDWVRRVEQFRFHVMEGSALNPRKAQLLVVLDEQLTEEMRKPLYAFTDVEAKRLASHGITLSPLFAVVSEMRADLYRNSTALYVPELGRNAWW